jgi:hypothetical protein
MILTNHVFRVLPSGGKTTLSSANDKIVDGDDIAIEVFGGKDKATVEAGLSDDLLLSLYLDKVISYANDNVSVVTNLDPSLLGIDDYVWVGYEADDYVDHIIASDRTDLTEKFSEAELTNWASDFESYKGPKVVKSVGDYVEVSDIHTNRQLENWL